MKDKRRTKKRPVKKAEKRPESKGRLRTGKKRKMGITDIFNKGGGKQDAKKPAEPKKAKPQEAAPAEPELSPELLAMSPEERAKHMAPKEEAPQPSVPDTKSQVLAPPAATIGVGSKVRIVQEVNLLELINNMDKLQAEIMALREIKFQSDEKAKQISEGLGELRAMVFQRDTVYKENDAKLGKMEVIVNEIQPQVMMAAIQKREKDVNEVRARIEKNDSLLQVAVEQIKNMQKELEHVRGVARVLEADKKITEVIPKIEESKSAMERLSAKSERLYFEIDKRLSEFAVFKEKVVTLEQLTRELMKMSDESKVKLDGCGSKDDVLSLKAEVGKMGVGLEAIKKQVESLRASGTVVTPSSLLSLPGAPSQTAPQSSPPQATGGTSIEALSAQREEVKALLSMLEDEYREGVISEKTFAETRMKNEAHLKEIEQLIGEKRGSGGGGGSPAAGQAPEHKGVEEKAAVIAVEKHEEPPKKSLVEEAKPDAPKPAQQPKEVQRPDVAKPSQEEPPAEQEEEKKQPPSSPPAAQQQLQPQGGRQPIIDDTVEELEEILALMNNTSRIRKQKKDLEKMLETVKKQHAKGLVSDDSYYNIVKSATGQIENRESMLKRVSNLPLMLSLSKKEFARMRHRKLELDSLMKLLEHQLSEGVISEKTYNDTKFATTRRLDEMQAKMSALGRIIESAKGVERPKSDEGNGSKGKEKEKRDEPSRKDGGKDNK